MDARRTPWSLPGASLSEELFFAENHFAVAHELVIQP